MSTRSKGFYDPGMVARISVVGCKRLTRAVSILLLGGLYMIYVGGCASSPEASQVDCPEPESTIVARQSPTPVQPVASSNQQDQTNGLGSSAAENTEPDPTRDQAAGTDGVDRPLTVDDTLSDGRPADVEIRVDARQTHQTIDGFGATHISLTYQGLGDVLCPAIRTQAIDAVYNQVGLNLGTMDSIR